MTTPSPLPSRSRAFLIVLLGIAPVLIEAAAVKRGAHSGSTELSKTERFLDDIFGRSQSVDAAVEATASVATAYLRIASLSIALYDFLTTIPAEWSLYMAQPSLAKMSRACILFIAVRYMSVAALVTSNVGFFGSGFSANVCKHYQLVAPLTKLFACLFSQIIVSIRTYAISRKEQWVKWSLIALFFASMVPEFLGNVYKRKPVQNHKNGNCTSGNLPDAKIAWIHYLAAMIFDVVVTTISTFYLIMNSQNISLMSNLSRLMLKEGILFFIFLTGVNILNLVMFRVSSIAAQSSAACLGQAVTMIMSQRIILGLHDWRTVVAPSSRGNTRPELYELSGNKRGASDVHHVLGRSTASGAESTNDSTTAVSPSANYSPSSATPLKSFIPNVRRTASVDDGNKVVHVHVQHEVQEDYDSVYTPSPAYPHPSDDHSTGARQDEKHWGAL